MGTRNIENTSNYKGKPISVDDDSLSFPLGEGRKLSSTLKNLGCAHGGERRESKRHPWECQSAPEQWREHSRRRRCSL